MDLPPIIKLTALLLLTTSCAGGRIYTSQHLHIGIRPDYSYPGDVALTIQVSTDVLP